MRRTYHLALAGAMLAIAACGEERLPSELQGRVYDVRLLAETSPADRIPGGTVAVTETDGVVSEVTVTAARLPAGEYSAYLVDERTGAPACGSTSRPTRRVPPTSRSAARAARRRS